MELRQLKYFITVYEEGQFIKAAEKLHITQSALSQQIQVLENELGTPLFDKQKRKVQRIVECTEIGREFYKEAKKILELSERLINKVKDKVKKDNIIRFGTYQLLNKKQIINTIERIRAKNPNSEFKIMEFSSPIDVQKALKDEMIDCGVTLLPINFDSLSYLYLNEVKMSVLMHENHKLRDFDEVSLQHLLEESWVEIDHKVHPLFDDIEYFCKKGGLPNRNIIQEVPSLDLLCHFVNIGRGLAFAPSYIDISDYKEIRIKKISTPFITLEQVLCFPKSGDKLFYVA
jgi:DNA-binding transcriptional LysR family regulator